MHKGRTGPLRLLRSVRGDGMLVWGLRSARPVSYCVDLYGQGDRRTGDGDVRGDLSDLVGRAPANVRLRLSDGQEAPVALSNVEADCASIELLEPVPSSL